MSYCNSIYINKYLHTKFLKYQNVSIKYIMLQHYSAYIAKIKMLITCYLGTKVNKFSGLSNLCQFKSTSKQIKGTTGKNSFCSSNNQNKPPLEQKKEIIIKCVLLYVYTTSKYYNF